MAIPINCSFHTVWIESNRWARMRSLLELMEKTCTSRPCVWANRLKSPLGTCARKHHKENCAVTVSFINRMAIIREHSVCRLAYQDAPAMSTCSGIPLLFFFCETTRCNFVKLENLARSLKELSTISAGPRVSIGMETQGRCFYAAECLRC